jgi:hypothetical protein
VLLTSGCERNSEAQKAVEHAEMAKKEAGRDPKEPIKDVEKTVKDALDAPSTEGIRDAAKDTKDEAERLGIKAVVGDVFHEVASQIGDILDARPHEAIRDAIEDPANHSNSKR